ncbi:MAG: hypothetical protein ABIQ73_06735 [Acidimicrobiales bacterium]
MSNREFDMKFDRSTRVGGRRFVEGEGRNEFMQPTSWNSARAALVIGILAVLGVVALLIFF